MRLFKSDGNVLTSLNFSLSEPTGYLSGLISHDVDVWVEGLHKNGNFTFSLVYTSTSGQSVSDDVHITLAQWDFLRQDEQVVGPDDPVILTGLGHLRDAIQDSNAPTPVAGAMAFMSRFDGLADGMIQEVRVFDPDNPNDYFIDEIADGYSTRWAAAYIHGSGGAILSDNERQALRSRFNLNAVDPGDEPKGQLKTALDVQARSVKTELPRWNTLTKIKDPTSGEELNVNLESAYRAWLEQKIGPGSTGDVKTTWNAFVQGIMQSDVLCAEAEQWPLLYFAALHALPVQFEDRSGALFRNMSKGKEGNFELAAVPADPTKFANLFTLEPVNMLNWRWRKQGAQFGIVATSVPYSIDTWNVTNATVFQNLQNATDKGMADPAHRNSPQNVNKIKVGDIVATANLRNWPGNPQLGHSEIITKIRTNAGKKEVYLATLNGQGQWAEIGALLKIYQNPQDPADIFISHGSAYVIRSINFTAFNKLADQLEGQK